MYLGVNRHVMAVSAWLFKNVRFLSLPFLYEVSVMHLSFWFNVYSIIKLFSLLHLCSLSRCAGAFVLDYISVTRTTSYRMNTRR